MPQKNFSGVVSHLEQTELLEELELAQPEVPLVLRLPLCQVQEANVVVEELIDAARADRNTK